MVRVEPVSWSGWRNGSGRSTGSLPDAADVLFDVTFPFGGSLHLGTGYDDAELIAASTPWRTAEPVPVSISLRERGKHAAPGSGAAIPDDRKAEGMRCAG